MAKNRVYKQSDISESDIFGGISESADKALKKVELLDKEIVQISGHLKVLHSNADTKSISGIQQLTTANLGLQKAVEKTTQLEKDRVRFEKEAMKQRLDEIRLNKAREKSVDDYNRKAERAEQLARKQSSAYNQMSGELARLKKEYKDLAAEEKHTTTEGKALLDNITKLDAKLKKIDSTVGEHTRKVGQYENVWSRLKATAISFFAISGGVGIARALFGTEVRLQGLRTALKNVTNDNLDYAQSIKFINDLSLEYGQDLTILTDTYKNFRASAKSSGLAIGEQNKIYQSVIKSGSALNMSNEQIEGSLLAISQMFSKGKVSAEELRGQLGERLPGAFGLMAKAIGVTESELNKMLEDGEVMAKDALPLLANELEKTFGEKAKNNLKTVSGAWNVLKTNLSNYISSANEGGRITESLANVIAFVGKNLGVIIPMILKLGVAFLGLKIYNLVKDFKGLTEGLRGVSTEAGKAESSSKKFGSALSNIATAYLITQFASLAFELYEIASGAEEAKRALQSLQDAQTKGQKFANDDINRFKKTRDLRVKDIELLQSQGKITEQEAQRRIKAENEVFKSSVESTKRLTQGQLERDKKNLEQAEKYLNKLEKTTGVKDALFFGAFQKQEKKVNDIKARIAGYTSELKEYNIVLNEQVFIEKDLDIEINNTTNSRRANAKAINDQKKALKEYNDELSASLIEQEQIKSARELELATQRVNDAIEQQQTNAKETGTFNLQMIYDQIDAETKLKEAIIQKQLAEDLANAKNVVDVENAQLKAKIALENLDNEQLLKKKDILIDLNTSQEDYVEKQRQLDEKELNQRTKQDDEIEEIERKAEEREKDRLERLAEFRKNMINEGLDQWKKASEEREKLIDREISASEKLAEDLRQQANNGTIQANESLAEQNRITNEKIQQKQKEQRIQQQIEEIKLLYNATEQYLQAGDTLPVAGSKAFLQVKGIKFLAQSLTGFFKGTKRTIGEELGAPQLSGKDGHIVRVDGSEMVFNGDLTNKVMSVNPSATTDEIVDTYVKSKTSNKAPVFIQNSTADERLIKEVQDLKNVMKNKTEFTMHGESISNTLFQIVSTEKKGADLIKTRHIYKKR